MTELERRHLTEKTGETEKHRAEYDQALGRAARAEGELAARVQEIEQAYRRLAGLEADIDAARAELGNREVRLAQGRDRISELEAKVADYEDQIVRAFQRIRADDKTTEKTRRALSVALALLDERAAAPAAPRRPATGQRRARAEDLARADPDGRSPRMWPIATWCLAVAVAALAASAARSAWRARRSPREVDWAHISAGIVAPGSPPSSAISPRSRRPLLERSSHPRTSTRA